MRLNVAYPLRHDSVLRVTPARLLTPQGNLCPRHVETYAPAVAVVEKQRSLENGTNFGFRALFDLREKFLVVKWWSRRCSTGGHKKLACFRRSGLVFWSRGLDLNLRP